MGEVVKEKQLSAELARGYIQAWGKGKGGSQKGRIHRVGQAPLS